MRLNLFLALLLFRFVSALPVDPTSPPSPEKSDVDLDHHLPKKSAFNQAPLHRLEEATTLLDSAGNLPPDPSGSNLLSQAVNICQLQGHEQSSEKLGTCKTIREGVLHPDHHAHWRLVTFSNGGMLILKVVEENPTLDKNAGWSGQKEAKVASIFDELLAHGKFQHIANSNKKTYWIFALKVKGQTLPNVPGLSDVNPRAIQQLQAAAKSLLAARRLKIDPWAFKQEQNWVYHMGNNKKPVAVFWPQRWAGAGGHNWVGALLSLLPGQSGPVPVELPDNDSVDWVITMMKKEFTKEERARYDAGSN